MRMITSYKPTRKTLPVAMVSTHTRKEGLPVSEILFILAPSVESALYKLVEVGPASPTCSGWILLVEHASVTEAMGFAIELAEAWKVAEAQETAGLQQYMELFNKYCPDILKIP